MTEFEQHCWSKTVWVYVYWTKAAPSAVGSRRKTTDHRSCEWRVYPLEWPYLQLWVHFTGNLRVLEMVCYRKLGGSLGTRLVLLHTSSIPPQGHDCPVRSMEWSHNGTWMVTTDDRGFVKYWQSNMNNVHTFQAHSDPVRSSRWDRGVCNSNFMRFSINNMLVLTLMVDLFSVCCNGISGDSLELPDNYLPWLVVD